MTRSSRRPSSRDAPPMGTRPSSTRSVWPRRPASSDCCCFTTTRPEPMTRWMPSSRPSATAPSRSKRRRRALSSTLADGPVDAVVVGSGPNGLAAAITLARAGKSVRVIEGQPTLGGGTRTEALTLPDFLHDVCSAIHPLAAGSPFFKTMPLDRLGLDLIQPDAPLAHPLDGGGAILVERSVEATAAGLGRDGAAYAQLMSPLVRRHEILTRAFVAPLQPSRHLVVMARFGINGIRSATSLAQGRFKDDGTRAALEGMAAHSMLPPSRAGTGAFALILAMMAHAYGWPLVRGGSNHITEALTGQLRSLGGQVETGTWVDAIDRLPANRAALFDVAPRSLVTIAGNRFPAGFRHALERYRYGPGVFKLGRALHGPIPWREAASARAGTVLLARPSAGLAAAGTPGGPAPGGPQPPLAPGARGRLRLTAPPPGEA